MKQDMLHTTDNQGQSLARRALAGFSLIELMIVVVILGALVAIIIPQFNQSESEAKDAGCDASNYGTLRQVSNYRSINGVYPSRLHTGFEANAAAGAPMGTTAGVTALAKVTESNYTASVSAVALTADQAASLKKAGIVQLAYGGFSGNPPAVAAEFVETATGVYVPTVTAEWLENHDDINSTVTINGVSIENYTQVDPYDSSSNPEENGIVVPLWAAPTADFENYYLGDVSAKYPSKVSVAQVGGCPWLEAGAEFRYYIGFFKVYDDGTPAKMIGTACPECGSLNP
jgi:prepilin-type N-terminal cleavage/methylation domain-containing protein